MSTQTVYAHISPGDRFYIAPASYDNQSARLIVEPAGRPGHGNLAIFLPWDNLAALHEQLVLLDLTECGKCGTYRPASLLVGARPDGIGFCGVECEADWNEAADVGRHDAALPWDGLLTDRAGRQ